MSSYLYRHFNVVNQLLYVGVTASPGSRIHEHAANSGWFDKISNITIERYDTKDLALAAERLAIENESPKYNIALQNGKKDCRFELRMTTEEKTNLEQSAKVKGISAGDYLRAYIRRTARKMRK